MAMCVGSVGVALPATRLQDQGHQDTCRQWTCGLHLRPDPVRATAVSVQHGPQFHLVSENIADPKATDGGSGRPY